MQRLEKRDLDLAIVPRLLKEWYARQNALFLKGALLTEIPESSEQPGHNTTYLSIALLSCKEAPPIHVNGQAAYLREFVHCIHPSTYCLMASTAICCTSPLARPTTLTPWLQSPVSSIAHQQCTSRRGCPYGVFVGWVWGAGLEG